jgi:hypothetical protein
MIPFLYEGVFQAVRMVDKLETETSVNAQVAVIRRRVIHPGDPDDPAVHLFQIKLASDTAVGAGAFGPGQLPRPWETGRLFRKCPGGAVIQTETAGDTAVIDERSESWWSFLFLNFLQFKGLLNLIFRTSMDTSSTGDTFIRVN